VIKNKHRIGTHGSQHFDFLDDSGRPVPLDKLFGKTTTYPDWYYGVTREIKGKTWWLVMHTGISTGGGDKYTHFDKDSNNVGVIITHHMNFPKFASLEQRAVFDITELEAKSLGVSDRDIKSARINNALLYAMGVREDSEAWELFYGNKKHSNLPISLSVKRIDDAINKYINKTIPRGQKKVSPTQPSKSGIKKLNNYTPVKVLNKINEIIDYLNTRRK